MRWKVGLLLAVLFGAGAPAAASDADIRAVIGAQMEALRAGDLEAAFTHASPAIRNLFSTPERFGLMVGQGYPMVRDNAATRFLERRAIDGRQWQRVMITDLSGRVHFLDYEMIETDAGWRINGVRILEAPGAGV